MPSQPSRFAVGACRIVTDEAINFVFGGEIERAVNPAVAYMSGGTVAVVGYDTDAEVIEHALFPKRLICIGI